MRNLLLWFGWISLVGSLADGAIALIVLGLAVTGAADWTITVDAHLRDHLAWLYWVRAVAEFLFPQAFVEWLFGLPALVYFPVRVLMSVVIGWWALRAAARMRPAVPPSA